MSGPVRKIMKLEEGEDYVSWGTFDWVLQWLGLGEEWAGSGESEAWLFAIVNRESRFRPWVRNPSGASGLFQMMLPQHADKFMAVGCDPSRWAEARCNAKAARYLYGLDSRHPWYLAGWHQ